MLRRKVSQMSLSQHRSIGMSYWTAFTGARQYDIILIDSLK